MKEEKITINEGPQIPEYKADPAKEEAKTISFATELNTLDEPIMTTIVRFVDVYKPAYRCAI